MKTRNCICHSNAWQIGSKENRIIRHKTLDRIGRDSIAVDACIADDVIRLLDAGIVTIGSCCGHGRVEPTICIDAWHCQESCDKAKSLVADDVCILQWRLNEVGTGTDPRAWNKRDDVART